MKENTLLFIIIGIFLLTLIFNYKEGFGISDVVSNIPANPPAVPSINIPAVPPANIPANLPANLPENIPVNTPAPATNDPTFSTYDSTNDPTFSTNDPTFSTNDPTFSTNTTTLPTYSSTMNSSTTPTTNSNESLFTKVTPLVKEKKPIFEEDMNYLKHMISYGKAAIQQTIDNSKNGNNQFTDTSVLDTKTLIEETLNLSKDIADTATASKITANATQANGLVNTIKTAYDYLNKTNININDLTSALNSLSTIPDIPAIEIPKPFGDECTETKVGCQWNNNPNDTSKWWTEHRENSDPQINGVHWNYHSLELGDYVKYPWVYRNPTDTGNGPLEFEKYLKDKENELKDLRAKMSSYDISFSSYQSSLKNNASLIDAINAEKERMKRDLSGNYQRPVQPVDDIEGATCPSLKCIADFGTNIGDDLCCGQTGVLQNTEYVCPSVKPTCQNFKCGSKFGTCV